MSAHKQQIAISAAALSKRFGRVQAIDGVDLNLAAGQALGLLGPNGAGKSTTLSILTGLVAPDAGTVSIFGHRAGSAAARALCGATPQVADFPDQLTPRELLAYASARYDTPAAVADLIPRFGLEALANRRVAGFSGGEKRRLALALAFAGNPKLVFLDEPTTGLDIEAQEQFQSVTRDYVAQGGAVILTSHHWDEIEAVCSHLSFIDTGRTVLNGTVDDLRARANRTRIAFELPQGTVPDAWMQAHHDGFVWSVETTDSDAVIRRMVHDQIPFHNLTLAPLSLRDLIDRIRTEETTS